MPFKKRTALNYLNVVQYIYVNMNVNMNVNNINNLLNKYSDIPETAKLIFYYKEDSYQGDFMVIYKTNNDEFIWSIGNSNSCSSYRDDNTVYCNPHEYTISDNMIDILAEDEHKYLNEYLKYEFYKFLEESEINLDDYLNRSKLIILNNIKKQEELKEKIRIKNETKERLIKENNSREMFSETQELLSYINNNKNDEYYNDKLSSIKRRLKFNLDNILDDYAINNFPEWEDVQNAVQIIIDNM